MIRLPPTALCLGLMLTSCMASSDLTREQPLVVPLEYRYQRRLRRTPRRTPPRSAKMFRLLFDKKSESVGKPNKGHLNAGRRLPDGRGYLFKGRDRYGTDELVSYMIQVIERVLTKYPSSADLIIKDLSREHGGRFRPHKSHRSGRDADIGYYWTANRRLRNFKKTTPADLDAEKTWYFIEQFLRTGAVRYIFIDRSLQPALYRAAVNSGWRSRELAAIFEYPDYRRTSALIRHIRGHTNHMHLRLKCAPADKRCIQ